MVKRIILIIAIAMLAFSGVALASDTATVNVSATVIDSCKVITDGSLDFGNLDPAIGGLVNGTPVNPSFWCTNGTIYNITDDNGFNKNGTIYRMKHQTLAEYIPYSFAYVTTGTGAGPTTALFMDITGSVAAGAYLNASPVPYADVVTVTIAP
jgi:spore coat protein U-like protein